MLSCCSQWGTDRGGTTASLPTVQVLLEVFFPFTFHSLLSGLQKSFRCVSDKLQSSFLLVILSTVSSYPPFSGSGENKEGRLYIVALVQCTKCYSFDWFIFHTHKLNLGLTSVLFFGTLSLLLLLLLQSPDKNPCCCPYGLLVIWCSGYHGTVYLTVELDWSLKDWRKLSLTERTGWHFWSNSTLAVLDAVQSVSSSDPSLPSTSFLFIQFLLISFLFWWCGQTSDS